MIVFIHVPFPSFFGNYIIKPIARFAVPFFFMVSGYFLYHSNYTVVSKNMPKKIKRILLFAIISFVVYFIWALILNVIVWGISITEFIRVNFSLRKVVFFLCFNLCDISGLGGMAWYLWATVYGYIAIWIINRFHLYKIAYIFVSILVFLGITISVSSEYIFPIGPIGYSHCFVRNWLFVGLPFMLIGHFLAKNKQKLLKYRGIYSLLVAILGTVLACVEHYLYATYLRLEFDLYYFTVIAAVAVLIYAINNSTNAIWKPMAYIGKNLSLYIYLLHSLIHGILEYLFFPNLMKPFCESEIYSWILPIIVLMVTLLVSWGLYTIQRYAKKSVLKYY